MSISGPNGSTVYIYDDEHPPPHCHVVLSDKEEIVVGLPFLNVMFGGKLTKKMRGFLKANMNQLCDTWEQKHPKRI
jgi:hypothetical protein